ncbi:unnamed protein product (macronuclear) [Paramecium tetraurelia]|uniref:B box-type domain-containing protein n=1 Tax=Paramecium tetraurelia TaxID=5888 RepID=A0C6N7_PARTE|nr:uncharacterized protein GSPATT00035583001 [Paramecium tetraurelia]CAK66454.1 unnamed protein product [Paramecium tetraurelia]|eukprot:XP_001433851.1 hypothetical protein (macronuclear) [Paramecium tetraurelia strain d4-2]
MSTVPPIKCPTHKDYFITNMCILKQCTEPLCPECIPRHIKDHAANGQIPQIENIQNVRQEQKAMVFDIVQKLNEQMFLLSSTDEMVIMNNLFMKLEQSKQEIIKSINKRFDDYKQELQNRFREVKGSKNDNSKESVDIVKTQLQRMDILLNKFESSDYIQAILETFFNDIGPQIYQNLDKRCQEYQSQFPDIMISNNVQNLLLQDLDQYIQICNRNQKQRMVSLRDQEIVQQLTGEKPTQVQNQFQSSQIKKENQSEINQNKESKQLLKNNVYTKSYQSSQNQNIAREFPPSQTSFKPQFVHNTSELIKAMQDDQVQQLKIVSQQQNSFISSSEEILISCYADQRKILIYRMPKFIQPMKNLNISDFQEINLILDKRIAVGHQCIMYGKDILIMGGIERDIDRNLSIQSVYKVNLIQKTLNLHSNMIHRRQGFGACLVEACIYVCCGSSTDCEDSSINTLERFDGQRWTPLRSCMHACTGCSLGNINNEYLIKIGGIDKQYINIQTIEVYSIRQNTWFDLQIYDSQGNLWNEIPLHSGIAQINQNELMVFGGQIGEEFTDKSYVITLDFTTNTIRSGIVRRGFQVPTTGYVDQVKVYENSVYAIMTEGIHLVGTKKTVINCNSDKWIYINNINE